MAFLDDVRQDLITGLEVTVAKLVVLGPTLWDELATLKAIELATKASKQLIAEATWGCR